MIKAVGTAHFIVEKFNKDCHVFKESSDIFILDKSIQTLSLKYACGFRK